MTGVITRTFDCGDDVCIGREQPSTRSELMANAIEYALTLPLFRQISFGLIEYGWQADMLEVDKTVVINSNFQDVIAGIRVTDEVPCYTEFLKVTEGEVVRDDSPNVRDQMELKGIPGEDFCTGYCFDRCSSGQENIFQPANAWTNGIGTSIRDGITGSGFHGGLAYGAAHPDTRMNTHPNDNFLGFPAAGSDGLTNRDITALTNSRTIPGARYILG